MKARGQQIKVFSQICKIAEEKGWAIPLIRKIGKKDDEDDEDDEDDDDLGYVGAAVLEALVGFYNEPVAVPDFRSLYPTTIIDGNMCGTTLLKKPEYTNVPGAQFNYVKVDDKKTHVFSMDYMGLIPEILIDLLLCRDKRKQMMEDAPPGSTERMIHNGAQLALKISANSIYGFFGVNPDKAMLPCMPIAEGTTAQGRKGTFFSRDFAQDISNFRDIIQCTTHFPLYYIYLMKNQKGKCFHMSAKKILGLQPIFDFFF